MLLFVKKKYADAIKSGKKTFEIRAGNRYRNIRPGHKLSINGQFTVFVIAVEHITRLPKTDCYPADHPGPFFKFHIRTG